MVIEERWPCVVCYNRRTIGWGEHVVLLYRAAVRAGFYTDELR